MGGEKMQDLEKLLRLENYKIMKIEERSENKKRINVQYAKNIKVVFMIN